MGGKLSHVSDEALKHPLYEESPFPPQEKFRWIKDTFDKYYNLFHKVSLRLLECMSLGLGRERFFFHQWFERDSLSTFRAIHILPRSAGIVDSSKLSAEAFKLTTPEHADGGFITLLSTFGYPGLQVELEGEYRSIKPIYNQLVVNLGAAFELCTNYQMKATMHRVLDIGVERFSSPFFLRPMYTATIPTNVLEPSEKEMTEPPVVYGPWFIEGLVADSIEWKGLVLPDTSSRHRNAKGQIVMGETDESGSTGSPGSNK